MLLRELKEVGFLMETVDGTNFETAVNALTSNVAQGFNTGERQKADTSAAAKKQTRIKGQPPTKDVDAALRPVILTAIESVDPSSQMIQRKIESTLTTPEIKARAANEIDEAIGYVEHLQLKLVQDFGDHKVIPSLMKQAKSGSFEAHVDEIANRGVSTEAMPDVIQVVSRNKSKMVDALMRRADMQSFHEETLKNLTQNGDQVLTGNTPELRQGLLKKIEVYVGFLGTVRKNLEMTKALLSNREQDKEDASA